MIIIKKIKIKMDFYLCEYTNNRNFVDWLTYRQLNHLYYHYWSTIVYPNWCKYVQYQLSKITNLDNIFKTNHSFTNSCAKQFVYATGGSYFATRSFSYQALRLSGQFFDQHYQYLTVFQSVC